MKKKRVLLFEIGFEKNKMNMLNKVAVAEVVPSSKNTGLNPSEDFALMMRKC